MPHDSHKLGRELAEYFGVLSPDKFVRGFAREVLLIDPAGNDADCARELANSVFVEVSEGKGSGVTEADLLRSLWRVSKEWQRRLKRNRQLMTEVPTMDTHSISDDSQAREAVEEVFLCLNELPDEASTLLIGIMNGLSIEDAASAAGVPRATAYRWMKQIRKLIKKESY